jgi:transposase-like protein
MWPILKHLGKILRGHLDLSTAPLTCPTCGKPDGLRVGPTFVSRPAFWRCENCGLEIGSAR